MSSRPLRLLLTAVAALAAALPATGCGPGGVTARAGQVIAIGAESEYADVIAQVGGRYVATAAIQSNPNTDPHSFELSPTVAHEVAQARLVVQNGLGYDTYMNKLEAVSASSGQIVIDVARLLRVPSSAPNPHLWYRPATMPAVAAAVAAALSRLQPRHRAYFEADRVRFDRSLRPWYQALAALRQADPGAPVAVTEPVGDYLLAAAGARILTPFALQADVMNGIDPAPQDIAFQAALLREHRVSAFLYNRQVTDPLTASFLSVARAAHVPVVAVYETMPAGYDYARWMLAETQALRAALADRRATPVLR